MSANPEIVALTGPQDELRSEEILTEPKNGSSISANTLLTNGKDEGADQQWETKPEPLVLSASARWYRVVPDIFILIMPLCFLALGISMLVFNGQRESRDGNRIIQVAQIAPTVWPIVFAAVVGSTMRAIALRSAERGASLGVLEQLIGSQTLFGTLKMSYLLGSYGLFSLFLVCLWAFNPIGGQASLRAIALDQTTNTTQLSLEYLNGDPTTGFNQSTFLTSPDRGQFMPMIYSIFATSLYSPDAGLMYSNGSNEEFDLLVDRLGGLNATSEAATSDIWGNVRIPSVHLLEGYNPARVDEWIDVPVGEMAPYESLVGVPIRDLPLHGGGNISFPMYASYHAFRCSEWANGDLAWAVEWLEQNFPRFQIHDKDWFRVTFPDLQVSASNISQEDLPYRDMWESLFSNPGSGFFLDTTTPSRGTVAELRDEGALDQLPAREIILGTQGGDNVSIRTCGIRMYHVEVRVLCQTPEGLGQLSCRALAARELSIAPGLSNWTPFDIVKPFAYNMFLTMPTIFGEQSSPVLTPVERYIFDPSTALSAVMLRKDVVNLTSVPVELFENRFGLVFNTYWRASVRPEIVIGGQVTETLGNPMGKAAAVWTRPDSLVYRLSAHWVTLYFMATAILVACAVLSIVLRYQADTPEVLGHVSTVTRDSRYVSAPVGGSTLDGYDRARLLKRLRLRFQDVQGDEAVGRLAFTSGDWSTSRPIEKGRLYE